MDKHVRVVVFGNSLNMAGIAASLRADADLDVVPLDIHSSTIQQSLKRIDPSVIVFDLTDPSISVDMTLLHERPDLLLIGMDPSSDELLVLSCHPQQALSVADLVNVIHRNDSNTK